MKARGGTRRALDAVREMRALRRRAAAFGAAFPEVTAHGYAHWKLATRRDLVGRPAIDHRCAQILIDTAEALRWKKSAAQSATRVVAIIDPDDLFASEVCVFFDEGYFSAFASRDSDDQTWTRSLDVGLATRWGLSLPKGFGEVGYATVIRDEDLDPAVQHGEIWLIGEVEPRSPTAP